MSEPGGPQFEASLLYREFQESQDCGETILKNQKLKPSILNCNLET